MDGVTMHRTYSNEYGSASINANPDLPEGVLELSRLFVRAKHRGEGYGTSIMEAICEDADRTGTVILLRPDAEDGDNETLAAWYRRFGFSEIQTGPVILMARRPGATLIHTAPISAIAGGIAEAIRG